MMDFTQGRAGSVQIAAYIGLHARQFSLSVRRSAGRYICQSIVIHDRVLCLKRVPPNYFNTATIRKSPIFTFVITTDQASLLSIKLNHSV